MPTLLIGHLGWSWTREREKLKQKPACSKKLKVFSSKRPKSLRCPRPFQSRTYNQNEQNPQGRNISRAVWKSRLSCCSRCHADCWSSLRQLGGQYERPTCEAADLISLRTLIFKTRSNPVIRKHNTVLRCYFLGVFMILKMTLISVCVLCGCSRHAACVEARGHLMGAGSLFLPCGPWESNSGP